MKPKISLITLGVTDLQKSVEFYRALGFFPTSEDTENVAFFDLEGTWLSLFPREKLADDAGVVSQGDGFQGFTLAHNVSSEKMVDETLAHAKSIGAFILKEGQKTFWGGYAGYFKDPDGFLWEVAYNPFMDLT